MIHIHGFDNDTWPIKHLQMPAGIAKIMSQFQLVLAGCLFHFDVNTQGLPFLFQKRVLNQSLQYNKLCDFVNELYQHFVQDVSQD